LDLIPLVTHDIQIAIEDEIIKNNIANKAYKSQSNIQVEHFFVDFSILIKDQMLQSYNKGKDIIESNNNDLLVSDYIMKINNKYPRDIED